MSFEDAFKFVIGEEGGYVNNASDPGGETKYGISKRAYPNEDIANLTIERAKQIYRSDYWDALALDGRPYGAALCVFDCGCNEGLSRAKYLQSYVGPNSPDFVVMFQAERGLHYASLPIFAKFGRGWIRRLLRTAIEGSK